MAAFIARKPSGGIPWEKENTLGSSPGIKNRLCPRLDFTRSTRRKIGFPSLQYRGGITNVLGRVLGEGVSPEKRWVWRGELPGYVNGGLLGRITTKRLMVVRNPLDYVALVLAGREQGVDLPIIALGICTWRWLWGTIPSEIVFAFETSKSDGFANFPRECKIVNKSGYILPPKSHTKITWSLL